MALAALLGSQYSMVVQSPNTPVYVLAEAFIGADGPSKGKKFNRLMKTRSTRLFLELNFSFF